MATAVYSASKRRNVTPVTSILHLRMEDVDCTDAAFDKPPEDGQIVQAPGKTALNVHGNTFNSTTSANVTHGNNNGLAMVWHSAVQSDRQALSNTRVPVIRGPARIRTKLFSMVDGALAVDHATNLWAVGMRVGVKKATDAVEGSANRIVPCPLVKTDFGWCIGYVTAIVNNSAVAGTGEIEIQLYDKPIHAVVQA